MIMLYIIYLSVCLYIYLSIYAFAIICHRAGQQGSQLKCLASGFRVQSICPEILSPRFILQQHSADHLTRHLCPGVVPIEAMGCKGRTIFFQWATGGRTNQSTVEYAWIGNDWNMLVTEKYQEKDVNRWICPKTSSLRLPVAFGQLTIICARACPQVPSGPRLQIGLGMFGHSDRVAAANQNRLDVHTSKAGTNDHIKSRPKLQNKGNLWTLGFGQDLPVWIVCVV